MNQANSSPRIRVQGVHCNGITSGFDDEAEVAFIPEEYRDRLDQNWRWGEQWIPHAAWFALAISWQSTPEARHD